MNFWKNLSGTVVLVLTAGDPAGTLEKMIAAGIRLYRVEWIDDLTVHFEAPCQDRPRIRTIAAKRGDNIRQLGQTGAAHTLRQMIHRPVLMAAVTVLFALTLWLPTRVLFFQVEGNHRVPSRLILETAADCGIRFGASRRQVRSEKMKNTLLGAMPELKWAGINTSGCVATISVRERAPEEPAAASGGMGDIVSCRDAYVTEITVTRGSPLCTPGQVVQEGEVLISGVTDLGLCIQVTQAQGEVFGETERTISILSPLHRLERVEEEDRVQSLTLILGKKRINLWKGSGISPPTCGRMYKEYYLTLPGGFQLPARLGVETVTHWETVSVEISRGAWEESMKAFARTQLLAHMAAGRILEEEIAVFHSSDACLMEGRFLCREMIGRVTKGEANDKTD